MDAERGRIEFERSCGSWEVLCWHALTAEGAATGVREHEYGRVLPAAAGTAVPVHAESDSPAAFPAHTTFPSSPDSSGNDECATEHDGTECCWESEEAEASTARGSTCAELWTGSQASTWNRLSRRRIGSALVLEGTIDRHIGYSSGGVDFSASTGR